MATSKDLLPTLQKQISPIVSRAEELEITDEKSKELATSMLSELTAKSKAAEAEKKRITDPANLILKNERSRWKPLEDILGTGVSILRAKLGSYQTQQKKIADAAAAKIAARVAPGRGNLSTETAVAKIAAIEKPSARVETAAGKLQFRTDKKLKITDDVVLLHWIVKNQMYNMVAIDEKEVRAALLNGTQIDGAEIEEVQTPINTTY